MDIVGQVRVALNGMFKQCAEEANRETKVIKRRRKFLPSTLAQSFVLTLLGNPKATSPDIAATAAICGVQVSHQAIEKRLTPELADFFESLFRKAAGQIVAAKKSLAPILERFSEVIVLDSTVVRLPESQRGRFRGCGGSSGEAAVKFQTELDLRSGRLCCVELEQGRDSDGASSRQTVSRQKGSLRITDLGYFNLAVFSQIVAVGAFFLSRVQYHTSVLDGDHQASLLSWLQSQNQNLVDRWIELGAAHRLRCRIVAWKVPPEMAARRRRKLLKTLRKRGRKPNAQSLQSCDWMFLVTNADEDMLSTEEVIVLYRARWQIELLFKRWKSLGLIGELFGKNDTVKMVYLWARLCASLIQHWLTVLAGWDPDRSCSFSRIAKMSRQITKELTLALATSPALTARVLKTFQIMTEVSCRRTARSKPGTLELLRHPDKLEYSLS